MLPRWARSPDVMEGIAPDAVVVVNGTRDLKAVRDSLGCLPLPGDLLADVVLAASEIVTNALQYAGAPCELRAWFPTDLGVVRVEVRDQLADELEVVIAQARPDAPRGRGFHIIEQLTTRWGIVLDAPDGKVVWFEVDPTG